MGKHYLFLDNHIGKGDPELGALLMKNFIYILAREEENLPWRLTFMNMGVKLTCENSPVLEDLKMLAEKGVEIKTCGTCLDFYHLKDELAVGEAGNMHGSVEATLSEHEAVTIS